MLFFDLLIVTRTQPTKLGMQRTTIEYFLPSLLTKNPIIGPTRMAPAGKRGPIHPAKSNVTPSMSHGLLILLALRFRLRHNSWLILGSAGDVQANALPTLKDPKVTMIQGIILL